MSDEQLASAYAPSEDEAFASATQSTPPEGRRRQGQKPETVDAVGKAGKARAPHSLTVSFDDPSWAELERLAKTTSFGWSKTGTIRRSVRLAAWLMQSLKAGYKVALYKDGEGPRFVDLA
jgi:hypothetical protein